MQDIQIRKSDVHNRRHMDRYKDNHHAVARVISTMRGTTVETAATVLGQLEQLVHDQLVSSGFMDLNWTDFDIRSIKVKDTSVLVVWASNMLDKTVHNGENFISLSIHDSESINA